MSLQSHSLIFLPLCLFLTLPTVAVAVNILLVPYLGEGSHYTAMHNIATEMVNRGHNITMLVRDSYKENLSILHGNERYHFESFTTIITQETQDEMYQNMTRAGLKGKYMEWLIEFIGGDYDRKQVLECRTMFGDDDLMSRLRTSSFDLAIEDFTHFCPIVQYLRKNMEIPFVAISLLSAIPSVACVINRWPFNPSQMPEMFTVLNHTMSFQERLFNTGWTLFAISVAKMIGNSYDGLRHDFGIADTTPFYDGAELYLINSHFSLDFPKPNLPNTVMVGGLTTRSGQVLDKVSIFFNDCTQLCSTSRLPVVLFVCV